MYTCMVCIKDFQEITKIHDVHERSDFWKCLGHTDQALMMTQTILNEVLALIWDVILCLFRFIFNIVADVMPTPSPRTRTLVDGSDLI